MPFVKIWKKADCVIMALHSIRNSYLGTYIPSLTNNGFPLSSGIMLITLSPRPILGGWLPYFISVGYYLSRVLNSSPPGQNGLHFTDDISKCIFVNEKFCILIRISMKFVHKDPIDNNPALV